MNYDSTDLSSDFDVTAVDTDAFDKHELIVWASKLELESIDYRTTSIDLMEKLAKLSNSLTNSLKFINKHIYELKNHAAQKDLKLKNFIDFTISEKFDNAYNKLAYLSKEMSDIQNKLYKIEFQKMTEIEKKVNKLIKSQSNHNLIYENKINQLENVIEDIRNVDSRSSRLKNSRLITPPSLINEDSVPLYNPLEVSFNVQKSKVDTSQKISKDCSSKQTRKKTTLKSKNHKRKERQKTFARKLIFD
jgi:hypothetical protein